MAHDPLADLTDAQREAVLHETGPLLVVAGPGSGKTRVITRRIARLIELGADPQSILAITFTNKAAQEMSRRVTELCPCDGAWIRTFHSACAAILRRWPEPAGLKSGFSIFDQDEQKKLVRAALRALDVPGAQLKPTEALQSISRWKADGVSAEEALAEKHWSYERQAKAKVYEAYAKALTDNNAVDFDDILTLTRRAMETDETIRTRLQSRFEHVLIDEYQDTSPVQFHLARLFAMRTKNICATGDPDQSIYAFRKADIRNILDFEQHYPGAKVVRLEHNFRSVGTVLRAADVLIARNEDRRKKTLIPTRGPGEKVRVVSAWNEHEEGLAVADEILAAYGRGVAYRDIAVFYRTNAQSRSIEAGLRSRGIPYTIVKGVEFFQRAEVKDAIAYLRVLANPFDRESMERVITAPSRGVGRTSLDRMWAMAKEHKWGAREALRKAADQADLPARAATSLRAVATLLDTLEDRASGSVAALLEDALRLSQYEAYLRDQYEEEGDDRWANVRELVASAKEYDDKEGPAGSVVGFLTHVGLVSDSDAYDPDAPRVPLMTLHSAKGLEFREAIITGIEEGVLPHARSATDREALEEERRLLFVGITRAKDRLTLTYALDRAVRMPGVTGGRSRFLSELPQDVLDVDRDHGPASVSRGLGGDWVTYGGDGDAIDGAGGGGRHDDDLDEPGEHGDGGAVRSRWGRTPAPARPAAGSRPFGGGLGSARRGFGREADPAAFHPDAPSPEMGEAREGSAPRSLRVGGPVQHPVFGRGQVVQLMGSGPSGRAVVRFFGVGEKTLSLAHAKLTPLD